MSEKTFPPVPPAPVDPVDLRTVERQLGRAPRDVVAIAYRCPCGEPAVVETKSRLHDGSPFPTTFYLTCPSLSAELSTLESTGVMKEYAQELAEDVALQADYQAAHEDYVSRRERWGQVPEIAGQSTGGMPTRVKCLHALVGHSLAAGPGINPIGDKALAQVGDWRRRSICSTQCGRLSHQEQDHNT